MRGRNIGWLSTKIFMLSRHKTLFNKKEHTVSIRSEIPILSDRSTDLPQPVAVEFEIVCIVAGDFLVETVSRTLLMIRGSRFELETMFLA